MVETPQSYYAATQGRTPDARLEQPPGGTRALLCPSTTIPLPPPRKKKKIWKKMAFILGGRSSRRSCQAWPASWQKCHLLMKPHTHRNRQMVRLLAPSARREDWTRGGGEFDTVPGNSPNSGFEDNPRQDTCSVRCPTKFFKVSNDRICILLFYDLQLWAQIWTCMILYYID